MKSVWTPYKRWQSKINDILNLSFVLPYLCCQLICHCIGEWLIIRRIMSGHVTIFFQGCLFIGWSQLFQWRSCVNIPIACFFTPSFSGGAWLLQWYRSDRLGRIRERPWQWVWGSYDNRSSIIVTFWQLCWCRRLVVCSSIFCLGCYWWVLTAECLSREKVAILPLPWTHSG